MSGFPSGIARSLGRIVAAVSFPGPRLFALGDGVPDMAVPEPAAHPNADGSGDLARSLAQALYLRHYCGLRASPVAGADLLEALRDANACIDGRDAGWDVAARGAEGTLVVRSGARTRVVVPADLLESAEPGAGTLRRPREDADSQPGWYYALGAAVADQYEELAGARLYLDLDARTAAAWTGRLTTALDRYRVPFRFKLLRQAAAYVRIDSGVLYLPRRHAALAASLATDIARTGGRLGTRTPLFTRRIAPGIALADDPPGGASFGLHRMALVAGGIVAAGTGRRASAGARLAAVEGAFRAAGLDPARPWLGLGNVDVDLAAAPRPRGRARAPRIDAAAPWLGAADRIGARLVRDALWHRDRCTWTGWDLVPGRDGHRPAFGTLGGDLYAGTAGIALFLARLAAVTGDVRQREAALGALRHAQAATTVGHWPVGAYSGLGGVLHAALAVGDALGGAQPAALARALVARLATAEPADFEADVIDGRAGAIRALLAAHRRGGRDAARALAAAERFGKDLLGLARPREDGWSWRTVATPTRADLLGYAHGTAGIATALDELGRVAHETAYSVAAGIAWRYELVAFDAGRRNWPDYRVDEGSGAPDAVSGAPAGTAAASAATPGFACGWCHGAPGTALALARRLVSGRGDRADFAATLDACLDTVIAGVATAPGAGRPASFCLCHGVAGNAEILLRVAALTRRESLREVALGAAREGLARWHDSDAWPCGVPGGGEAPGLLLGMAGIGHFYLGLHEPALDSALEL